MRSNISHRDLKLQLSDFHSFFKSFKYIPQGFETDKKTGKLLGWYGSNISHRDLKLSF